MQYRRTYRTRLPWECRLRSLRWCLRLTPSCGGMQHRWLWKKVELLYYCLLMSYNISNIYYLTGIAERSLQPRIGVIQELLNIYDLICDSYADANQYVLVIGRVPCLDSDAIRFKLLSVSPTLSRSSYSPPCDRLEQFVQDTIGMLVRKALAINRALWKSNCKRSFFTLPDLSSLSPFSESGSHEPQTYHERKIFPWVIIRGSLDV